MTKAVTIKIDGFQNGVAQDQVSVVAAGNYRKINGSHYIHYIEAVENKEGETKNTIRLTSSSIEMIKSGLNATKMVFDKERLTKTSYNTPYGSFHFVIHTTLLTLEEYPDYIHAELKYTLSSGDNIVTENGVKIHIRSEATAQ